MRGDHSGCTPSLRGSSFGRASAKRIWPALLLAAMAQAVPAAEPAALTERQAVEFALSRPLYRDIETGRLAIADSAVAEASQLPNPVFTWEQDRVGGATGRSTESTAKVYQSIDFSGRRALRREAATIRRDAARLDQQDRRLNTIVEVRRVFSELLYRQELARAYARWSQRIEAAAEVVRSLAKAGEASGYDRRRLEREAQAVKARAAGVSAEYARVREGLTGLTGTPSEGVATLAGELLPGSAPPLATVRDRLRQRPDLASLGAQADAYDRERMAAERAWIPDVTLGIGQKRSEELGRTDTGTILAISIPLPLFDRGAASRQQAQARASTLRAEQALSYAKVQAELRGVWRQVTQLREAAIAFRRDSLGNSHGLTRVAEAAYRAGEGGILELLDAYRSELDAETITLDLELRARLARIELDALSGIISHE